DPLGMEDGKAERVDDEVSANRGILDGQGITAREQVNVVGREAGLFEDLRPRLLLRGPPGLDRPAHAGPAAGVSPYAVAPPKEEDFALIFEKAGDNSSHVHPGLTSMALFWPLTDRPRDPQPQSLRQVPRH